MLDALADSVVPVVLVRELRVSREPGYQGSRAFLREKSAKLASPTAHVHQLVSNVFGDSEMTNGNGAFLVLGLLPVTPCQNSSSTANSLCTCRDDTRGSVRFRSTYGELSVEGRRQKANSDLFHGRLADLG